MNRRRYQETGALKSPESKLQENLFHRFNHWTLRQQDESGNCVFTMNVFLMSY